MDNLTVNLNAVREFVETYNNTAELAKRAGVNRTYIYRVLNGERKPGLKFINGMMAAGMKKEDILTL